VLEAVAQLTQLESLSFHVEMCEPLLTCLPRLSGLRSLSLPRIRIPEAEKGLKPRFLDCCRQLAQLRSLDVAWLSRADVAYLLRAGH